MKEDEMEAEMKKTTWQRIKAKAITFAACLAAYLIVLTILFLMAVRIISHLQGDGYERPESVDTPSLLSLPRDEWPAHGLDAVERGLIWGQCGTCGFPVTKEDVRNGFGESVGHSSRGYYWEEFVCYRHILNSKPSVYMLEGKWHRWHSECRFPHSWDNKIEYIINHYQFRIYYG